MARKKKIHVVYKLRVRTSGQKQAIQLACPGCGTWGYLDDRQIHGKEVIECPLYECNFSEMIDLVSYPDVEWVEDK